jgi:hypothetical protein
VGIVSRSQGGGSAASAVLFDSTLGAPANAIDTGAAGIGQTQNILEVWIVARTDAAGATDTVVVTLNNDATAIYDKQTVQGNNVTASASPSLGTAGWTFEVHGNGGLAGYASVLILTIPAYAQTTFFKSGYQSTGLVDSTAGNNFVVARGIGYRATTAISRLKVAQNGAGNLLAGSRLLILGR